MKNLNLYFACMAIFTITFTSCSKDENLVDGSNDKTAILSFASLLNDIGENKTTLKQAMSEIPECSDTDPSYVEIVLSGTENVGSDDDPLRIDISPNPGDYDDDGVDEYFTEESSELELTPGSYTLEHFVVYDAEGNMIWVAPIDGSDLTNFVDNPLPIDFELGAGEKKYIGVEVLCFDNRMVNEYGYLFFEVDEKRAIEFCIFGNYCDENGRHNVAEYNIDVYRYEDGQMGEKLYDDLSNTVNINDNGEYAADPLCIALPDDDGLDEYYFEITIDDSDAYGDIENRVIRAGVINDDMVRSFFDNENNLDYYHFREGECETGDNVPLFPVSKEKLFASPNGSGNSCSQSSPCSLETAISKSNAGDVVLLKGGVYSVNNNGVRFNRSGQSGEPITYESYPGELAIIDGSQVSVGSDTRVRVTGDWNTIRRIEIRNMPHVGLFIDGNHNLIDGVISHDNYYSGIQVFSPYDSYPYGDHGSFNTIQNSIVYNNFDEGGPANGGDADGISISSGEGNKVLHNLVYDNSDDGIDVWRSTNTLVAYNSVSGSGRANGNGNGIKAGGADPSRGTFVHHNIAYNNRETGIAYNLGNALQFFNNTSYNNSYGYSGDSEVILKNNISFENERNWVSSAQNEKNSWQDGFSVSSSDFVSLDPNSAKFLHLAPGSDLIDAGIDVGLSFEGNAPDLGAYEYGAK